MAYTPFQVDGTVLDTDGSTAVNKAKVVILNTTTGERTAETTNSSGQFVGDLANLTSGYSNGDKIQTTVTYGTESSIRSLTKRFTVVLTDGSKALGNIILHPGEDPFTTCNITFAALTNSTAGGLYVDFYNRNDILVFRIDCGAATSIAFPIGYLGVKMDGGFVRVFESEASGSLNSLVVFK